MIGRNITKLRKKLGISQYDLAEKLKLNQSSIAFWETGRNIPSGKNLVRLAEILKVPVEVLTSEKEIEIEKLEKKHETINEMGLDPKGIRKAYKPVAEERVEIPLYGKVHAGEYDIEVQLDDEMEVPASVAERHPNAYMLKVVGDCMDKIFPPGCYIMVDPDMQPNSGSVVVVCANSDEYMLRRIHYGASKVMLSPESHNPVYKDETVNRKDDVAIAGVVVWYQAGGEMV